MKRLTLSAIVLMAPIAAQAQDLPVYYSDNHDLTYSGHTVTLNEYNSLTNQKVSAEALARLGTPEIVVFDKATRKYALTFLTPEDYEFLYLKDGKVPVRHSDDLTFTEDDADGLVFDESEGLDTRDDLIFEEHEGTDTREIEPTSSPGLTIVEQDGGPLDLFADENPTHIMPADGTWKMVIEDSDATGCQPGIAAQARSLMGLANATNVSFSKPKWHPTDISASYGQFDWQTVGENGYYAPVYDTTPKEAAGSGMSVLVSTALYAKSDSRIDVWNRISVNLSAFNAAIVGSSQTCRIVVRGKLMRG